MTRDHSSVGSRRSFVAVLAVLFAVGWMANHFAAVIPALRRHESLSSELLDGVFGVYALGLLPGLLGGGALSDRVGRAPVVLPGTAIAVAGTLSMGAWHAAVGLLVGRLVVGLGAGLAFGAGTAWTADLRGARGTVLVGVVLTCGFAAGPLASGVLAQWVAAPLTTPFLVAAGLGVVAIAAALAWHTQPAHRALTDVSVPVHASAASALGWALPLAPFVFGCATVAFVTLPARLPEQHTGPLLPGIAATLTLGTGIVVQLLARRRGFGPGAGTAGAVFAAAGFALASAGGPHPSLLQFVACCLLLGSGYGLCLRAGLLDLEVFAPAAMRGALTGVFYVGTYLGFALPLLLVVLEPQVGAAGPLLVLAGSALLAAGARAARLAARDRPLRR